MNFIIGIILSSAASASTIGLMPQMMADGFYDPFTMYAYSGVTAISVISTIWSIVNIVPGISICVRRLHDIGRSWPWIFIAFIPVAGWIILIVFMASSSKYPPENQFGFLRQV